MKPRIKPPESEQVSLDQAAGLYKWLKNIDLDIISDRYASVNRLCSPIQKREEGCFFRQDHGCTLKNTYDI